MRAGNDNKLWLDIELSNCVLPQRIPKVRLIRGSLGIVIPEL